MVFDCFDGLIARATDTTTDFGGQLDSLADIVNHGVAPATLMLAFMTTQLHTDSILPSPISEHFLGRASWVAAAIYVAFQAIRLARYNVEANYAPPRTGDIQSSLADITRARELLGFEPSVSFEEGLRRTFEWYKSQYS